MSHPLISSTEESMACELLCAAVIKMAVQDYASARKKLEVQPDDAASLHTVREVKAFFASELADLYTSPFGAIDGEILFSKLAHTPVSMLATYLPHKGGRRPRHTAVATAL